MSETISGSMRLIRLLSSTSKAFWLGIITHTKASICKRNFDHAMITPTRQKKTRSSSMYTTFLFQGAVVSGELVLSKLTICLSRSLYGAPSSRHQSLYPRENTSETGSGIIYNHSQYYGDMLSYFRQQTRQLASLIETPEPFQ